MEWMEAIGEAINYMEAHITEEFTISDVADHVCISPFYFLFSGIITILQ